MRSEQDRRMTAGGWQQRSPQDDDQRFGSDSYEGQYEKDPWHSDWRRDPPGRGRDRELRGRHGDGAEYGRRAERRSEDVEPYEPSEGYEPFEPGHPREEGRPFGTGPSPRYLGTGFPGRGGPGFTGGYYGFGAGSLQPDWRSGRRHPLGEDEEGRSDWRTQQRRYPPGPKGYQRSDERLREDISERLMQAGYIDSSDVSVEVSGAKVVLDGTVPERRMKHAIEDLVDACPGVQDIDNRIRVKR
ncbi:MAG TPA: BON domain-containing protein [Steroidobacteraceae bacterium]|nr:BON domain-containing protein [Steroidobacteraceae bacterium]